MALRRLAIGAQAIAEPGLFERRRMRGSFDRRASVTDHATHPSSPRDDLEHQEHAGCTEHRSHGALPRVRHRHGMGSSSADVPLLIRHGGSMGPRGGGRGSGTPGFRVPFAMPRRSRSRSQSSGTAVGPLAENSPATFFTAEFGGKIAHVDATPETRRMPTPVRGPASANPDRAAVTLTLLPGTTVATRTGEMPAGASGFLNLNLLPAVRPDAGNASVTSGTPGE